MFFKYTSEELASIEHINHLLKEFEKQLKILPSDNSQQSVMALGRMICEDITQLLLKKEGMYDLKKQNTFYKNTKKLYQNNIIPKECNNFLQLIMKYGDKSVHGIKISDKFVLSFLNAFNFFIQWFDSYYCQFYQNAIQIKACCNLINSMEYDKIKNTIVIESYEKNNFENYRISEDLKTKENLQKLNQEIKTKQEELKKEETIKKEKREKVEHHEKFEIDENIDKEIILNNEIRRLREELKQTEKIHQIQIDEILKRLDEQGRAFEICLNLIEEINERSIRIESKIDVLNSKIDNISNNISAIQSFCERQINNAQSTEEIEEIISTFIDVCIDKIMQHASIFKENENYRIEKTKLIHSIGEEGWNKLCEKSKTFLITSKVMYNHLITMDDIIDYSGICVLVTKALEVEIHKRFFTEFLDYLNNKYANDYEKYHTALLYKHRTPLFSEKFTMGNIAFVMCYKEDWNDTDEQKTYNKFILMEYCKDCIFSRYDEDEIERLLTIYASSIEEIRETYRNPSAHTNEIKRIDAEECFNLVLDVEKLLKEMIDSFDN